jgi:GNAT superfamily N-acetyltransferase
MTSTNIHIRMATEPDVPVILGFIQALAEYERLRDSCVATEARLRRTLFGPRPAAEVLIASIEGKAVGIALFFHNYSTFLAQQGIYLEDLFVNPEARGHGVGYALLSELARIAVDRDCGRLEWAVLDWNQLAIDFYKRIGADPLDGWTTFRMTGHALHELAAASSPDTGPTDASGLH